MIRGRPGASVFIGVSIFLLFPFSLHPLSAQPADSLQQRYASALRMMGQDRYDQAISALEGLLQKSPQLVPAYVSLAEAFIYTGRLSQGRQYFSDLLRQDPTNPYPYYCLARFDFSQKKYDAAIAKLKKSIELDPGFADAYGPYGGLPEVYRATRDLDSGIQYFKSRIALDPGNACSYYGLARCYIRQYEWEKALTLLDKAISLNPDLTLAYHSKIYVLTRISQYDKAIELSKRLREVARKVRDAKMFAYGSMMVGSIYFFRGDYLNALQYLHDALQAAKDIGDKQRESTCLNTIAATYAMTANFTKALQYFNQAVVLARKTGSKIKEVQALGNIANVYKDQGNPDEALTAYKKALAKSRENGFKYEECLALSNMAEIYRQKKEFQSALEHQQSALKIAVDIEDRAEQGYILRNLGSLYLDLNDIPKAIRELNKAHAIGQETKDLQIIWETEAGLGACYEKRGAYAAAIKHFANAIAIYDSVRNNLDIESLRDNFLEDKYLAYPSIVSLLCNYGQAAEALRYAEKYKAKTMLDIMSQGKELFRDLLPDSLKTRLRDILEQNETAHRNLSLELVQKNRNESRILELDQKITHLELAKAAIFNRLKKQHREYYRLTVPEILQPEEIQNLLRENQSLIEYVVGADKTTVFVVSRNSLHWLQIPVGRTQFGEKLAKLSALFQRREADAATAAEIVNPQLADFSIPPAHSLYETLVKPVEAFLQGKNDLIIVPDDVLFYLPFGLLVTDTTGVATRYDFAHARFLIEDYSLSYLSSASLLNPDLQKTRHPGKGLLAMGNPNFDGSQTIANRNGLLASKDYRGEDVRDMDLVPLPQSGKEVRAIGRVLKDFENTVYTGKAASESSFKREAPNYGIIHLATHFLYDDARPLYSQLVLSHDPNSTDDGYLQTYEIFNLRLNADLAVLSACNSGLGKLRKGEGLIGVSRAFLFAGVPSMVLSLWNVDDKSTSVVMERFYHYLGKGENKKQALRLAKLDYLKSAEDDAKDPFYWAPFILTGDDRPIELPEAKGGHLWITLSVVGAATFSLLIFFLYRKRARTEREFRKA